MHNQQLIVQFLLGALILFSSSVRGQSDFAIKYRARLNSIEPNSPEYLLEMFALTDALRKHDLKMALTNARSSLELANQRSNHDFQTVARLDEVLIRGILDGQITAKFLADASYPRLSDAAPPELKFHFYEVLIESVIYSELIEFPIEPWLVAMRDAAEQCPDRSIVYSQRCVELYARAIWRGELPSERRIMDLVATVNSDSAANRDLDGRALLSLLEYRIAQTQRDKPRQNSCIEQAISHAQAQGNRFLESRSLFFQADLCEKDRKIDQATSLLKQSLTVASRLSAPALIQATSSTFGLISARHGGHEPAIEFFVKSENTSSFENSPIPTRNLVYAGLRKNLSRSEHPAAAIYEPLIYRRNVITEIQNKNEQLHQLEETLVHSHSQAEAKIARIQAVNLIADTQTQSRILFFQRYAAIATLVILVLLPWFILYYLRQRLRKIANELVTEKQHSHHNQVRCDDLALRLNRVQRMESLGLMAGGVAHDFNNILVGVLGNAELIQLNDANHDRKFIQQRVARIVESAEKAADLSRQMLAYAGKQQIARQRTNLNDLIHQYQSILQSACQKNNCRLVIRLETRPCFVHVDPVQIEQAMLNLVTNAVAASEPGSEITIKSGLCKITTQDDPTLYGTSRFLGDFCFVEVCDHGHGISESEKEQIFEPFFTRSDSGRGLGLSVVYGVMEGHGGLIQCRSEVSRGTSFRLLLPDVSKSKLNDHQERPFHDRREDARTEAIGTHIPAPEHGQTILIIDDEETVLELCQQLLEMDGWKVITAQGGETGLEKLTHHLSELSCVLMDVVMPEMGANELLKEMESHQISIPVVLMSGFSQIRLEFFFTHPNVVSIVAKPFRAADIQQAVLSAANQSRVRV